MWRNPQETADLVKFTKEILNFPAVSYSLGHSLTATSKWESFIKFAKFSEKLIFLKPWYAHLLVRITGYEVLDFRKILQTF